MRPRRQTHDISVNVFSVPSSPFSLHLADLLVERGTECSCVDQKGRPGGSLYTRRVSGDQAYRRVGKCVLLMSTITTPSNSLKPKIKVRVEMLQSPSP